MKISRTIVTITIISLLSILAPAKSAYAASQDECAIWLCLPGGFPAGCAAAYSAFKKRIKKLKPPLPPFSGCVVSSPTAMTFRQGIISWIPPKPCFMGICPKGHAATGRWVRDRGCTGIPCRTKRYIEVKADGIPSGKLFMY